jgi:hypothetical protein
MSRAAIWLDDQQLHRLIKARAAKAGMSLAAFARMALREWMAVEAYRECNNNDSPYTETARAHIRGYLKGFTPEEEEGPQAPAAS